jgi:hypothetical protein
MNDYGYEKPVSYLEHGSAARLSARHWLISHWVKWIFGLKLTGSKDVGFAFTRQFMTTFDWLKKQPTPNLKQACIEKRHLTYEKRHLPAIFLFLLEKRFS